ncbi:hypothetical protein [Streptomyces sp. NPDC001348]
MTGDDRLLYAAEAVRERLGELAPLDGERLDAELAELLSRRPAGPEVTRRVTEVLSSDRRVWAFVQDWLARAEASSPVAYTAMPQPGSLERASYGALPPTLGPVSAPEFGCREHPWVERWYRHSVQEAPPRCPEPGCGRVFVRMG